MGHKIEVVNIEPKYKRIFPWFFKLVNKHVLATVVVLDIIDFVLGKIPVVNIIWDVFTCYILLLTLKNKWLALFALTEIFFPAKGLFGNVDAYLPISTLIYLVDYDMSRVKIKKNPFHKQLKVKTRWE
jgi:hypothetical protein